MSFAKTQIIGHLGRDVELRHTPQGDAVANFSVATSERFKKDGEQHERVLWWAVTVWGRMAEICNQYLSKGSQVWLDGKPGFEEYVSRDGEKKFTLTLRANEVQFLGSKGESNQHPQETVGVKAKVLGGKTPVTDDEVPW
jgi:single-strand DNA-binding protein